MHPKWTGIACNRYIRSSQIPGCHDWSENKILAISWEFNNKNTWSKHITLKWLTQTSTGMAPIDIFANDSVANIFIASNMTIPHIAGHTKWLLTVWSLTDKWSSQWVSLTWLYYGGYFTADLLTPIVVGIKWIHVLKKNCSQTNGTPYCT